jgi:hypothetical protein
MESIAWGLLVIAIALWLGAFGRHTIDRVALGLSHPTFQMDNEEGALLYQSLLLKRGATPYRPITDYPYVVGTYPPLYLALAAPLTSAVDPTLYGGRMVSAVALFVCLAALAGIVAAIARSFAGALLAPALFLATFEVYSWAPYFRVDCLALALSLLGLLSAIASATRPRLHVFTAILFALAFFTKQTAVAAPLAFFVTLTLRSPRRVIRPLSLYLAAVALPFILFTLLTRGQFFVHTVVYNANRMNWPDLIVWLRHLERFYLMLGAAAVVSLAVIFQWRTGRLRVSAASSDGGSSPAPLHAEPALTGEPAPHEPSDGSTVPEASAPPPAQSHDNVILLICYVIISLANVLALAKAGSAENYLLELLAAIAILVGCATGVALSRAGGADSSPDPFLRRLLPLVVLAHAIWVTDKAPLMFSPARNPSPEDFRNAALVTQHLRSARPPVISELACYTLFAGRDVVFQPFIMSELARQGRWNASKFIADLRAGRFGVIAATVDLAAPVYTDAFTDAMRAAIRETYECRVRYKNGRLWDHYLFYPRSAITAPRDSRGPRAHE